MEGIKVRTKKKCNVQIKIRKKNLRRVSWIFANSFDPSKVKF